MVRKMRVSLALQPVATALFANSPFTEGRPNGFLSFRAQVWTDTDPIAPACPRVFFEDGFGFERYAQWLVDEVPMYFVYRNGRYVDMAGQSFRRFMAGQTWQQRGRHARPWATSPITSPPSSPMCACESSSKCAAPTRARSEMMVAQSALWVGLLYDNAALAAAEAAGAPPPWTDFRRCAPVVPRAGAERHRWHGGTVRDLAREMVHIAADGLRARARLRCRRAGRGDLSRAAATLVAEGAPTQAEHWLARFHGPWHGDVREFSPKRNLSMF